MTENNVLDGLGDKPLTPAEKGAATKAANAKRRATENAQAAQKPQATHNEGEIIAPSAPLKCPTCVYFHDEHCRRYPPDSRNRYPEVPFGTDWCGEHRAK